MEMGKVPEQGHNEGGKEPIRTLCFHGLTWFLGGERTAYGERQGFGKAQLNPLPWLHAPVMLWPKVNYAHPSSSNAPQHNRCFAGALDG
jgi:hypothetical protein